MKQNWINWVWLKLNVLLINSKYINLLTIGMVPVQLSRTFKVSIFCIANILLEILQPL